MRYGIERPMMQCQLFAMQRAWGICTWCTVVLI